MRRYNAGTLPSGLSLSSAGVLAGTPTTLGAFNFTVKAMDAEGCMDTQAYTINITAPGGLTGLLYVLNDCLGCGSQIYGYAANELTGALALLSGFPISTGNLGEGWLDSEKLTIDRANLRLYALISDAVRAYSINPATGALTPLPFSPINLGIGRWNTIAVHPSGSPLVIGEGSFGIGSVASYRLTPLTATPAAGSPYSLGSTVPHSAAFSQDGAYVYLGGGSSNNTSIAGFSANTTTSVLTALPGSPFNSGAGNPLAYATDVAGRLFVANWISDQVRVFTTASGIPSAVSGNPFTSGLAEAVHGLLHPNGFYLVADRGNDGNPPGNRVGVYRINGSGSATTLTAVPGSPFAAGGSLTDVLALNQAGTFLFAANGNTRNLTTFGVNLSSGALTAIGTQPTNTLGASGRLTGMSYLPLPCSTITLSPAALPGGSVGAAYDQTITASPSGIYTYAVTTGSLPAGLSLSTTGALTGTPVAPGLFNFTIKATDTSGCMGTRDYTLAISPPCGTITVNPATLPNGFAGVAYNQPLMASGGGAPYIFTISAGALPAGLSLSSAGVLAGTPATLGAFNFTVKATDNSGCMGTRAYALVIDSGGLQYYPLPRPIRLVDSRAPIPGFAACEYLNQSLLPDGERVIMAHITCDGITIPTSAQAIVGNATIISPSAGGFATLWPDGQPRPPVSNLNYVAGQVVPNAFTVGLSSAGKFRIYSTSATHFIADVTGYYAPPGAGGLFYHPLPRPIRLYDTRAPIPGFPACEYLNQPLLADAELAKQARITCDGVIIPADAMAIAGNATVVNPAGGGFITLYPNGQPRPPVSNLNYVAGQVVPNAFTVGLGSDGQFRTYSFAGTHFVVDVTGYYSESATDVNGAGLLYSPLPRPIRLFDTRAPIPGFAACEYLNQPLLADSELAKQARITCDGITIPADAKAIVGNATVVNPAGGGFVTLWPNGQPRPPVSNLNYVAGQVVPNAFTVGLGNDGQFRIYSFAGTHFITDVTGYFAP